MAKPRYEYQVSESAQADRKRFTSPEEALQTARQLSRKQPHPVYIDVYDLWKEELADRWFTIKKGRMLKHYGFGKDIKCSVLY